MAHLAGTERKHSESTSGGSESTSTDPKDTVVISRLPLMATAPDIEDFFGVMVDTYMRRNKDGNLGSRCYVQFENDILAQEALKKDNEELLGCSVKVHPTSVTLGTLRAKKQYWIMRVLPFKVNVANKDVIPNINEWYPNLLTADMISKITLNVVGSKKKTFRHSYALIEFKSSSIAESVMKDYEEMLEKKPIAASKIETDKEVHNHMNTCQKQMFWWEP